MLPDEGAVNRITTFAKTIQFTGYYRPAFDAAETELILRETDAVATTMIRP
jgi:hypothetical protein